MFCLKQYQPLQIANHDNLKELLDFFKPAFVQS